MSIFHRIFDNNLDISVAQVLLKDIQLHLPLLYSTRVRGSPNLNHIEVTLDVSAIRWYLSSINSNIDSKNAMRASRHKICPFSDPSLNAEELILIICCQKVKDEPTCRSFSKDFISTHSSIGINFATAPNLKNSDRTS